MKTLRALKIRAPDFEDIEIDFRGLGGLGLLENSEPWVFVTFHGIELSKLELMAKLFNVNLKKSRNKNLIHCFIPKKFQNHKEKTISLLGFALAVLHGNPKCACFLGDISCLALKIKNLTNFSGVEDDHILMGKWQRQQGLVTVTQSIRIWLDEIVFSGNKKESELHTYNFKEIWSQWVALNTGNKEGRDMCLTA